MDTAACPHCRRISQGDSGGAVVLFLEFGDKLKSMAYYNPIRTFGDILWRYRFHFFSPVFSFF